MTKNKRTYTPIPPVAELPPSEAISPESLLQAYLNGEIDLICILGPTASGKTGYAVKLAQTFDKMLEGKARTEIISADSRQIYRGMDIGTGKDLDEYGCTPYHLIDIVDAGTKYDIYHYKKDFSKALEEIKSRGNIPILCGGSGLYIEAATCGYSLPEVPPNPNLRSELEQKGMPELIEMLAKMKPLHNSTDYDTKKRLIRAIEIALYEKEHPVTHDEPLSQRTYFIGTLVSRQERNARIDRRLDARLKEGMLEEIKGLLSSGIPAEDLIYYGLEYKFVTLHLIGELSFDQMKEKLATAIHQFAKRQMTWFRGMERKGIKIHWTEVNESPKNKIKP